MRFLLLIFLCACSEINHELGLKDDNIIEEIIEDAIFLEFHQNIDLTPDSKEIEPFS